MKAENSERQWVDLDMIKRDQIICAKICIKTDSKKTKLKNKATTAATSKACVQPPIFSSRELASYLTLCTGVRGNSNEAPELAS